ncbi:magnesium transporter CorA family protein [Candidatus Woesearchaeota archaeon]|nr:magnesium transporter CorA family protein [Candidatus Woesearchaeota archaeon]
MINCVKYADKSLGKSSVKNINVLRDLVWIDVSAKDKKELKEIQKKFNLNEKDLEDSIDIREVTRVHDRINYSFVVLRSTSKKNYIPVGVFVSKRFLITIHMKDIPAINSLLKNNIEIKDGFSKGIDFLFCKVVSEMNKKTEEDIEKFDDELDEFENKIINSKLEKVDDISPLKRKLNYYKKALSSNKEVMQKLLSGNGKFFSEKNYSNLNYLNIEIMQSETAIEFQREKLTGILEMHMIGVSNKLNDIMRVFTVVAALFLLPTVITGIWGMNFAEIPFFGFKYGFYIPIVIIIISMLLLYLYFKRKKLV